MTSGASLVREGREMLEAAGWITGTANHNKPLPKGIIGWPLDIIAVRDNHVVMIECKGEGDRLKKAQVEMLERLHYHMGSNVQFFQVSDARQFEGISNWGR